jgi:hypothetical protein
MNMNTFKVLVISLVGNIIIQSISIINLYLSYYHSELLKYIEILKNNNNTAINGY